MINIIGAGPVGSYLAYLLARKGEEVQLFEEHSEIGKPVRCSATFTNSLSEIIPLKKDFIVNRIKKIRLSSPNNDFLDVNLRKENIVLDRSEFDKYLVNMAVDNGVKLFLNHKLLDIKDNELVFKDKKIKKGILIGADGPLSLVAKKSGLLNSRIFLKGMQARVEGNFDKDMTFTYLNIGEFSWIIPENENVARVGVVCRNNPQEHFKRIYDKISSGKKIIEYQGGLIPLYDPSARISKDNNTFLIGDAAGMVKPTTYGGIVPGLLAANILSKDFDNYEIGFKNNVEKDLKAGLLIRKTLNKFSDEDYNSLINLFKQEKLKVILEDYERDFPSKFLFKLLLKEPRLLKFALKYKETFIYK